MCHEQGRLSGPVQRVPPGDPAKRSIPLYGQVYLLYRRRRELAREGDHRRLARAAAEEPRRQGVDPKAGSVHQRRRRNDEPVSARGGLRHRRRRRDRPRLRPLRAVHRRSAHPRQQRHDGTDLSLGDRQGAARRLSRRDRSGDPAHHQRDQDARDAPRGAQRRRRVHRRGRRDGRRHRVAAVPRSDPASAPRHRRRERDVRAPDAASAPRAPPTS